MPSLCELLERGVVVAHADPDVVDAGPVRLQEARVDALVVEPASRSGTPIAIWRVSVNTARASLGS